MILAECCFCLQRLSGVVSLSIRVSLCIRVSDICSALYELKLDCTVVDVDPIHPYARFKTCQPSCALILPVIVEDSRWPCSIA